ncbi:uncharacterized protein MONOS_2399 [Monocercomonoides exilis]|uniref:uncharacterized protein n=1 Tax=Monocercomonoides exilis TaxID=2049356 RepID=UPI00355AA640|nr:hypothetical protein MONOS_2399 [Monocercomonoides exilis]|eukprot:MONOS_2399.1-p1 / transcript=MONOS_2399.1 / gene=MONOS_2399 / organism=Monocercomonoides_exilis_PA203 / gene_product=unspecified product / transcript_product=unspecified product / location=Mono_scaffold00049:81437-83803(-) / protein_length=788 / sequence_SO=supercontig / SO=protein_coding / is_pseudo=false
MFVENCTTDSGSIIYVINGSDELTEKGKETNYGCFNTTISSFTDIYVSGLGKSVIDMRTNEMPIIVSNCSFQDCSSNRMKGSIVQLTDCHNVTIQQCYFDHLKTNFNKPNDNSKQRQINEVCRWNGSAVDATNSELTFKDTTIANFRDGGLSLSTGTMTIEKGEFLSNNPFIEKYPSVRRNIICSDSGTLTISSLKGGDGVMLNSSVWILDGGCTLGGIAGERESPFFIPKLEDVSANENGSNIVMKFNGKLLLPCDLSFRLLYKTGDVELVETYPFEEDSFVSETEVIGTIQSDNISKIADETEVSVMIVFGKQLASTPSQILKNKSESRINGNERIVEGGKEQKSFWPIIVIIMAIILMIVLIVSIIATVRWRKQKRRTEELEVIVEDTVRKDPKAFEMVTMEMSLEEQWRRAEREAEKKNEEKIKKRVYEKSLGHSESSEHLLSESGSTEYILGKDSDKIPDWAFEKVDEKEEEEEETRKRTLSPSISSTSTTDSDSTFVRGEDLCPTTSSMSNLVDAMACSSPHEKLIVDLRDSLFMLLHGRNEKKEMAIGSLQEREQTASQILFWVANLALHSFDEMENSLQSLANLSPHIVLFSEHMVICIVMHSDFSSDHDSDSSSISSSTVVSSASDDDDDSLPSSAFEDEDDLRKECLRWKAPELLMNKKMGATKESVAFSIGMMLWECLTLQLPFGDYPAEVSGQKIVNGERPDLRKVLESSYTDVLHRTFSPQPDSRTTLIEMKREFIQRFPAGAVMLTISDAIDFENESEDMGSDVIDSIPMSNGS